jgi:hypothetical protein
MKSLRICLVAGLFVSVALTPLIAQTISAADAKSHIGEKETVCGLVTGKYVSAQSQGTPTFIDLDKPYPDESFTVVIWQRDKSAVGTLPSSGQLCVTGTITNYRGRAEIVLHDSASWSVPSTQLSNDRHYTNSDGQQVHSPAYSSGGVPAGATALCGDGTFSFSQHRSGTCSHHGGVAKWF